MASFPSRSPFRHELRIDISNLLQGSQIDGGAVAHFGVDFELDEFVIEGEEFHYPQTCAGR